MNKKIIIILSVLLLATSLYAEDKTTDGLHKEKYKSGKLKRVYKVVDGEKVGHDKTYHEFGFVLKDLTYKDGKLDGYQVSYDNKGNVEHEWYMERGNRIGEERFYFEDGELLKKRFYKNDRLFGAETVYRKNGLVHKERNYKNGKLDGVQKDYWLNGNRSVLQNYLNGEKHGEFILYSPDGQFIKKSEYIKGELKNKAHKAHKDDGIKELLTDLRENRLDKEKEIGKVDKHFVDTDELKSTDYKNDLLNDLLKDYFVEGGVRNAGRYIDSVKDGVQIIYYDNGDIQSEFYFVNGILEGVQKFFFKNGVLKSKENYKNGKLDGVQEYYYENGVLMVRKVFKTGSLLRLQRFENIDGVLKMVEELIEVQADNIVADEESLTGIDSEGAKAEIVVYDSVFYGNGNVKIELEAGGLQKLRQRVYFDNGGLQFEARWNGGDFFFYEEYNSDGKLINQELGSVYKNAKIVKHDQFCTALNGVKVGDQCTFQTNDANKSCIDSVECQAFCVAYGKEVGAEVKGQCSASDQITGCYQIVEGGKAQAQKGECT